MAPSDSLPVIKLEHVSKTYTIRTWKSLLHRRPGSVEALVDVSFSVRVGEIMGLLGPNGAGKTTLLKILATLVTPDSGTVSILDMDVVKQAYQIRQKIGFVNTNSRAFYWRMSGRENLLFFGKLYNLLGKHLQQRVDELLDLMKMQEKSEDRFGTYSSGERQRFAIARAMLADPEILLMDEATSNLDPIASQELIEFVKTELSQKHKKTIIWCTHNLSEAEMLCDRLAILHKGRIIRCGGVEEIKRSMVGAERYRLTVSEIPALLYEHQGFENGGLSQEGKICSVMLESSGVPGLLSSLAAVGVDVYGCSRIERPLEEAFTNMMKDQDEVRSDTEMEWGRS